MQDEPLTHVNPVNPVSPEFGFALRPAEDGDLAFVSDSWRRSYAGASSTRCPGGLHEYNLTQRCFIEAALASSLVLVAYPKEPRCEPAQILGWVCYRPPAIVHYVYVKEFIRRMGLAHDLVKGALGSIPSCIFVTAAHQPGAAAAFSRRARTEYNPALIFGGTP